MTWYCGSKYGHCRLQAGEDEDEDEEDEDVEEMPLVRNRSTRHVSLSSTGSGKDAELIESSTLAGTTVPESSSPPHNDNSFPSDEV
jgi:hypothetical protein